MSMSSLKWQAVLMAVALGFVDLLLVAQAQGDTCRGPLVQIAVGNDADKEQPIFGVFAPFGRQLFLNETLSGHLAIASPLDGCSTLDASAYDAVVLVQRGACSFTDKAAHVQEARARAMLLYDNEPGCVTMGYENSSTLGSLVLPSISISQESGERLQSLLQSHAGPLALTVQPMEAPSFDPSAVVLWLMAVGTVLGGSLWAGHDYALSKKPGRHGEVPLLQGPASSAEVVDITAKAAVGFVALASCMLLVLFFFLSKAFFYVLLVLFSLASVQSMTVTLAALLRLAVPALAKHSTMVTGCGPCPTVGLLTCPPAAALVVVWAVMRNASWSWVLQDVQGICLMLLIFRTLRISSVKVACVLLSLTFVYDVFWVFIQPLLFGGGKSVMVEVAEGGGANEFLPMLLRVPYMGLPRELGGYSMLGFGDVILPGLLVAYTLRIDMDLHLGPAAGYFVPTAAAYAGGLVLTYVALVFSWFGDQGQPALLYLVPCTLGAVLLLGHVRGDLPGMWNGSTGSGARKYSKLRSQEPDAASAAAGESSDADLEGGAAEEALLLSRQAPSSG